MNQGNEISTIRRYRWMLTLFWTVSIVMLSLWMHQKLSNSLIELHRGHARAFFEKDLSYRRWNAIQGGLYAPISEYTPPNEYLEVPERDVVTTSGIALTLINPAYMTRQVHELASKESGVLGHITSLNPIRPENAADTWEKAALESL
jgi:hypothetical protein